MAADETDEHPGPAATSPPAPLASPRAAASSNLRLSPSVSASDTPTRDSEDLKAAPVRTDDYDDDDDPLDAADALLAQDDHPRLTRSRASSFSVDFSGRLLQLTASTERGADGGSAAERGQRAGTVKEHVSLAGGCALVVGIVIGSGIFSSPGVVAKETGSVGTALFVWLAAGLLSWAGGSSFAELGSALPMNGGHQVCASPRLSCSSSSTCCYCTSRALTLRRRTRRSERGFRTFVRPALPASPLHPLTRTIADSLIVQSLVRLLVHGGDGAQARRASHVRPPSPPSPSQLRTDPLFSPAASPSCAPDSSRFMSCTH